MKLAHLLFTLAFLIPGLILQAYQAKTTKVPSATTITQPEEIPQLKLTTSIISQRYCQDSGIDESVNLQMKVRLRYSNSGTKPLILYKHDNTIFRTMVSLRSTNPTDYLWDLWTTVVTDGKEPPLDGPVPGPIFITLAPHQFYDTDGEVIIFVRRDKKSSDTNELPPGDYFLRLSVSTWPESRSSADSLSNRWRTIGTLWWRDIISEPMRFKIVGNHRAVNCFP